MSSLIYYYTDGACGSGKTYQALSKIAMAGGRHLFVVDRKETMMERQAMMTQIALACGQDMPTLCVTSDCDRQAQKLGVRRRIHDLASTYTDQSDITVFITHEGMRMCDFSGFSSWSIWVDEVPDILDNESMNISVSRSIFDNLYTLVPIMDKDGEHTGWSEITAKEGTTDAATVARDDLANGLSALHRRILEARSTGRRSVIVNGTDWSEFDGSKKLNWFSVWSPELISNFLSVNFLANAFTHSLTFQIMRSMWPHIEWMEVRTNTQRMFEKRRATIHYYADSHLASRNLFGSDHGKANLAMVCADINVRVGGRDHIWMCNQKDGDHVQLTGRKLAPKQAGSNEYAGFSTATCIYSVKPDAHQRKVYELLRVDPGYYCETHERETILQFMCRTSLRDPASTADLHFFVYDREQAEYLLRYFNRDDRGYVDATMELHDLGFADVERKNGRPSKNLTPDEKREAARLRKAAQRNRDRLVKLANLKV